MGDQVEIAGAYRIHRLEFDGKSWHQPCDIPTCTCQVFSSAKRTSFHHEAHHYGYVLDDENGVPRVAGWDGWHRVTDCPNERCFCHKFRITVSSIKSPCYCGQPYRTCYCFRVSEVWVADHNERIEDDRAENERHEFYYKGRPLVDCEHLIDPPYPGQSIEIPEFGVVRYDGEDWVNVSGRAERLCYQG
jgi:hypothetical protein